MPSAKNYYKNNSFFNNIRSGRIRTHDQDFGDPYYNRLNYTPLL